MDVLGISAYYHDSAAVLLRDGEIIAAAQEERFSRKKHDAGFPANAVRYCLAEGEIEHGALDVVGFYEKPILKFDRILRTFFSVAPKGLHSFMMALPLWAKKRLWIPLDIETELSRIGVQVKEPMCFPEHHESHIASAFFPSPFDTAAILTVDGVGEWATSSIAVGRGNKIETLQEMRFPHSLGLLYSAFTYFTGFRVNSGEYKLMGLAPYGEPKYVDAILSELIELKQDGSFRLNMEYFGYLDGFTMTNNRFAELFGGPARQPEAEITKREMDLARSIQAVTEEVILRMANYVHQLTGLRQLCLAGGVALNCVANGRLLREGPFEDLWIQPAAGDAGGALGAAYVAWHSMHGKPRDADGVSDKMAGAYLGPEFPDAQIEEYLLSHKYSAEKVADAELAQRVAQLIAKEKVIGLFYGRMEFGPRALGNRSIIGDVRSPNMQRIMNLKIKHRESFRPFAPSCLEERVGDYFELDSSSPYMLLVAQVKSAQQQKPKHSTDNSMRERINEQRSDVPAITHVDYSARIQTVAKKTNPRYHSIITAFEQLTGCGMIINTSFNVRGEPIVCTPDDAYKCFMRTEMDYLVLGNFLLNKTEQPDWSESKDWEREYPLD